MIYVIEKELEQNKIKGNHYQKDDRWYTVLSKKEARQEKVFMNREYRLRNSTSFFISNLPDSCNQAMLKQAFSHLDNMEDVFVPFKKDRAGNKFGFLKLSNVRDLNEWIEMLNEVRVDGAIIEVSLAKFDRFGAKIEPNKVEERASVFSRLYPPVYESNKGVSHGSSVANQVSKKSYSSVVCPNKQASTSPGIRIDLPPMITDTKKKWQNRSLIGETKDIAILNDLKNHLSGIMDDGIELRYLGGLKVLLCFHLAEDAEDFRNNKAELWEKWFSRLYIWDGIPPLFERVAWIKVTGVPISLWDRHVFNKIGERCVRLLVQSEVDASDGNMAEDRMAILVYSGSRL
ncbi:putative RNA recognition motif domain, nucleotide-binding alpha-beta plait domain superfamily [Helianthus annuus]|nr:putative RNA recognition motif domain, nucleotide-binding alpha-beta plait domain superfamily [Helianthus annuus]